MKKIMVILTALLMALSLAACGTNQTTEKPAETATPSAADQAAETPGETPEATEEPSVEDVVYEFEFADMDGNVHKLSDYRGQAVYLRVWASWCGVCVSSLPDLNKLAGEDNDFVMLSVVMPDFGGEMSAEDFTKWYKDLGYTNVTVLFDPDAQVMYDFGINAFPSQIMFDAQGHIAYGVVGSMDTEQIKQVMAQIAAGKQ